jgi:flagellin FlaB
MVMKQKKGSQGIGTLIIFIAMILVAAVAAGVLIQTASSLQSKALDVGRQSQEKVTTDMEVIQVYVRDTADGNITEGTDNITLVVRLGSGSVPIKLDDLLLRFDTMAGTQSLLFSGDTNFSTSTYGITYKVNGSNHLNGYLGVGDMAEISFTYDSVGDIAEGETATIRLLTKNGAVKPVQLTTPSAMTSSITYLYP